MKRKYKYLVALTGCLLLWTGCNDEWKDEQYIKYLSFVNSGVTKVYLKYGTAGGKKEYRVPIQVGGSQLTGADVHVDVAIDMDTLAQYNRDNFHNRTDLYYKQLEPRYYNFENMSMVIPAGETQGFLDVDFTFQGLDNYDNYILPLKLEQTSDLRPREFKGYNKSLMHLILFNDYSGEYKVTSEIIEYDDEDREKNDKIKVETRETFVVDENTIFFYAGFVDEKALDRKDYRVYAKFTPQGEGEMTGSIELWSDNPEIGFTYDAKVCSYSIAEAMDELLPYLKRRYVTANVSYTYLDITNPQHPIKYRYTGPMIMERVLNILMPEEDQIVWN